MRPDSHSVTLINRPTVNQFDLFLYRMRDLDKGRDFGTEVLLYLDHFPITLVYFHLDAVQIRINIDNLTGVQ